MRYLVVGMRLVGILLLLHCGVLYAQDTARINLNLENDPIVGAMGMLSDATGFNILLSKGVTGSISAFIVDMDPEEALRQTIEVNGFHYVKHDDVVWVMSDDEYYIDLNLGRTQEVLRLSHARTADLLPIMQAALSPNGTIIAYTEANVLVVKERSDRIEELRTLFEQLDVPIKTHVFALSHAPAEQLALVLQRYAGKPDSVQADFRTNQIVISDTEPNLKLLEKLIQKFDISDQVKTQIFRLKYANATEVAGILRALITGQQNQQSQQDNQNFGASSGGGGNNYTPPSQSATASSTARSTGTSPAAASPPSSSNASAPRITNATTSSTEDGSAGLGPLAMVTDDPRTNSVIVTHTESVLARLATVIDAIDIPSKIHTFQFMNADPVALDVAGKLAPLLTGQNDYFTVDQQTRKVSFRTVEDRANEIVTLLQEWDEPIRQVRIQAEILSVNSQLIRELGVSWQGIADGVFDAATGEVLDRSVETLVNFPAQIGFADPVGSITFGSFLPDNYAGVLQFLESDSDTRVVASPNITAIDGGQAIFSNARREPYTIVTLDGATGRSLEDVQFLDIGVTLQVVPTIATNGLITMDVTLEISELAGRSPDGIPIEDRSAAQSTVAVEDGGVIILGGLRATARTRFEQGVPFLRKIPLLGGLFRNRQKNGRQFDIVLVLRPKIIGHTEDNTIEIDELRQIAEDKEMMGKHFN